MWVNWNVEICIIIFSMMYCIISGVWNGGPRDVLLSLPAVVTTPSTQTTSNWIPLHSDASLWVWIVRTLLWNKYSESLYEKKHKTCFKIHIKGIELLLHLWNWSVWLMPNNRVIIDNIAGIVHWFVYHPIGNSDWRSTR